MPNYYICPELPAISEGEAEIFGGAKARNPNGTVNYTSLELM